MVGNKPFLHGQKALRLSEGISRRKSTAYVGISSYIYPHASISIWVKCISLGALLGLITFALQGCGSLTVSDEIQQPSPARPIWSSDEIRGHLRVLNAPAAGFRGTGTDGFANVAAYFAARMAEFKLQPVLSSEFRVIYQTPLHRAQGWLMQVVNGDTLLMRQDEPFRVDGRSDRGRVFVSRVGWETNKDPLQGTRSVTRAVALPLGKGTTTRLQELRDDGVRLVLLVGELQAKSYAHPIRDLLVIQIKKETWDQLRVADPEAGSSLQQEQGVWTLTYPVGVQVETQTLPYAGALNLMGYVSGKHPALADELVLICADVDALPSIYQTGANESGTGAAAGLEVARQLATFSRHWLVPGRTVLFAFWSGSQTGHAGLREYLARPMWSLEKTRSVIYVGIRSESISQVAALVEGEGISFIPLPAQSVADTVVTEPLETGISMQEEIQHSLRLAEQAYALLFQEAVATEAVPAFTDSLLAPSNP